MPSLAQRQGTKGFNLSLSCFIFYTNLIQSSYFLPRNLRYSRDCTPLSKSHFLECCRSSDDFDSVMSVCRFENAHRGTIISLFFSSTLLSSCNGYVNWIYPGAETSGLVYNHVDTVYFTWVSNITGPSMNLWCAPSYSNIQSQSPGKL